MDLTESDKSCEKKKTHERGKVYLCFKKGG